MAKSGMLGHEGKGPFDMGFLKDIRRVYGWFSARIQGARIILAQ